MNKRIRPIPYCFIKIKCIFLHTAIKGNQPLLVLCVLSALVTAVRPKIKQIPHIENPQVRTFFNQTPDLLMVKSLVSFAIVASLRICALKLRIGIRSTLAESDRTLRKPVVIGVKKFTGLLCFSQIPAVIEIIAARIRNVQDRAGCIQCIDTGQGAGYLLPAPGQYPCLPYGHPE